MDVKKLGEFIREKRKEKGLTQEEMARQLGMTRQTLGKIEKGYFGEVSFLKVMATLIMLGYDFCVDEYKPDREDIFCNKKSLQ